jgi:SDR family mycofactocin-dependent oxidoreductase
MGRLDGKVALVTGGARGIGRAIAEKLAVEGADVVICDICAQVDGVPYELATDPDLELTAGLVERAGRVCLRKIVDVRDQARLDAVVAETIDELGKLDIVCANAAVFSLGAFWELSEKSWSDLIDINLTGAWKTAKAAAPHMLERRSGSIILTSSVNGREPGPAMAHYVASKHGVIGLMKSLAFELGPYNVRANAVLPGPTRTLMSDNAAVRERVLGRQDMTDDEYDDAIRHFYLLSGRTSLPPSAIADAVAWLASDEAQHVTGVELAVDAGHSILPGMNMEPVIDPP